MMIASASITITQITDGLTTFYQYAKNASNTVSPSTGWDVNVPVSEAGKFIWRREGYALTYNEVSTWVNAMCLTGATGTTGATGAVGPAGADGAPGPQGPPGNPGQLGLYADENSLFLKGFAEDGTLTGSIGYIYINENRTPVPAHTQTLTAIGQGYVLFDPTWASPIRYAKLVPNMDSIDWRDYNTSASITSEVSVSTFVLGIFKKNDSIISETRVIRAVRSDLFPKECLMDVLASGDFTAATRWSEALDVQHIWRSIAVVKAFIDELKVNHLEITDGTLGNFRFLATSNGPGGKPLIQVTYMGNEKFSIDPETGNVVINGEGTFNGLVKSRSLKTQDYQGGAILTPNITKTLWRGAVLYAALSSVSTTNFSTVIGTVGGIAVIKAARLASTATYLTLYYFSQYTAFDVSYIAETSGTHTLYHRCSTSHRDDPAKAYRGTSIMYVNGVQISYLPQGDSEYGYTIQATINRNLNKGDVVRVVSTQASSLGTPTGNGQFKVSFAGYEGVLFLDVQGNKYNFKQDAYYSAAVSISAPDTWNSASNLTYYSGEDWYNHAHFNNLTVNLEHMCNGSANIDGTPYTLIAIKKTATNITYITAGGSFTVGRWGGEGYNNGIYTTLILNVTLIGAQETVYVSGLQPKPVDVEDGSYSAQYPDHFIGSEATPFQAGYFNTMNVGGRPTYSVRAWVATGDTTTIKAGSNVSSVSEPNVNQKRVNFTVAMPDVNYAAVVSAWLQAGGQRYGSITAQDVSYVNAQFSDDASVNPVDHTNWIIVR